MSQMISAVVNYNQPDASEALRGGAHSAAGRRLLRVAWLAVLLGILLELVLLLVKTLAGEATSSAGVAVDMAQKVSWSLIVCIGVAAGQNVSRALQPLAAGSVGLLAAPLAFAAAKGIHVALSSALQLAAPLASFAAPNPWVIALVKGIEFALLGASLAWLMSQAWAGLGTYAACGLASGLVFGTSTVAYISLASNPQPAAVAVVLQAINELTYPLGCSCVIYSSNKLGQRFTAK